MKLIWSPTARANLREIFDFYNSVAPSAARRIREKIFERTRQLQSHPELGKVDKRFMPAGRIRFFGRVVLEDFLYIRSKSSRNS